jgi:hypothetical protein
MGGASRHTHDRIFENSALWSIAQSYDSALCRIAPSRHFTLCRIARSLNKSYIHESALCQSMWNSSQKFSCRLRYAVQWVSRLRPMPHSGESRLRGMPHSAELRLNAMRQSTESISVVESKRISPRIRIYNRNRLSRWFSGPSIVCRKNQRSKISWDCSFKYLIRPYQAI